MMFMAKETNITRIIRAALQMQDSMRSRVPEKKRREGEGRISKLVVDDPGDGLEPGPNHTVLYLKVENGRLRILDDKPDNVRNEIIFLGSAENHFNGVDLFTQGLYEPGLFREAYTKKWLIITDPYGDLAEYDAEEMLQLCTDLIASVSKKLTM
jgi:hypothetical protein